MTGLPALMVAPNGARHGPAHHPRLPVTLEQTVATARACFAAGADGLHLHLRDARGAHLLDAGAYREALAELARAVPGMAVQVTTEAAGRYASAHQRRVALEAGCAMVSAAVREILADTGGEVARRFYRDCAEAGIAVQHILYDRADLDLLARVLPAPLLHDPALQLLFVLGRYGTGRNSAPAMLTPFLDGMRAAGLRPDWAACAFGRGETACLRAAHDAGGKMRVGFENSIWRADGSIARDNAQRVADIVAAVGGTYPPAPVLSPR